MMIPCSHCREMTDDSRNFCIHCGYKIRDLVIRLGKGTKHSSSIDYFLDSGDPAVFASPGALDYDPELAAKA